MNAIHTPPLSTLSERLNQKFQSVTFRAHGPFSVRADDLVLDLSPALDYRDPCHRTLGLSGGFQSIRRPAFVRVILSVSGAFHPDCDEPDVWVIEDLGLIELGDATDIDIAGDATFHLAFAEPLETSVEVTVDGQRHRVTLPGSEHGWSCDNPGIAIAADADLPKMALVTTRTLPRPLPPDQTGASRKISGKIVPRMLGGGAKMPPLTVRLKLDECPLGLVRIEVWQKTGLLGKQVLRSTLWPVFYSQNDRQLLDNEIPASFVIPDGDDRALDWDVIPLKETDIQAADVPRIQEILKEGLVLSKHFPEECRTSLQRLLQKLNEQKAG